MRPGVHAPVTEQSRFAAMLDSLAARLGRLERQAIHCQDWNSKVKFNLSTTNVVSVGKWRHSECFVTVEVAWRTTGAVTAGNLSIDLPHVPSNELISEANGALLSMGRGTLYEGGVAHHFVDGIWVGGTLAVPYTSALAPVTNAVPFTWGAGDGGHIKLIYRV